MRGDEVDLGIDKAYARGWHACLDHLERELKGKTGRGLPPWVEDAIRDLIEEFRRRA